VGSRLKYLRINSYPTAPNLSAGDPGSMFITSPSLAGDATLPNINVGRAIIMTPIKQKTVPQ
jgi:hypothetical protein